MCDKCGRESFVVELSKKCPFCDTNKTVEEKIENLVDNMNAYVDCVDWAPDGDEEFKQKILDLLTSQRQTLRNEVGKMKKEDKSLLFHGLYAQVAYNQALADVLSLIDKI